MTTTEVIVNFKRPPLVKFVPGSTNYMRLQLTPQTAIALGVQVKKPGENMIGESTELSFFRRSSADEMDGEPRA